MNAVSEATPLVQVSQDYRNGYWHGHTVGFRNCMWRSVGLIAAIFSMMIFVLTSHKDSEFDMLFCFKATLFTGATIVGVWVVVCGPCDKQEID